MNKIAKNLALAAVLIAGAYQSAWANTLVISGTLLKQNNGTTFDTWKISLPVGGSFSVDVRAYEASQNNTTAAGYFPADLNGDNELTWLDADTYIYHDDGHLDATDAIVRCDDVANNCAVYQNGLTAANSPVVVSTRAQAEAAQDGSIHFRRDPWYEVSAAAGNYLFLMADYRLDPAEAVGGINANDNFSAPTNFVSPILDHADYQVKFSSNTLNFTLVGNTINVSQVPLPAAGWLFGSALSILGFFRNRKRV